MIVSVLVASLMRPPVPLIMPEYVLLVIELKVTLAVDALVTIRVAPAVPVAPPLPKESPPPPTVRVPPKVELPRT